MFEILFSRPAALKRHRQAPFSEERGAYLKHLIDRGTPLSMVRRAAFVCRWVAEWTRRSSRIPPLRDEDIVLLFRSWARRRGRNIRRAVGKSPHAKGSFHSVARCLLGRLGWLAPVRKPPPGPDEDRIQAFIDEQRRVRELASDTCNFREKQVRRFLAYLVAHGLDLERLCPSHLDAYFQHLSASWCRISLRSVAVALRAWLDHCEKKGYVRLGMAKAILVPRVYTNEGLPLGPTWEQVSQIIAETEGTKPPQLRARAVLLLLAVYGLRPGEVLRLRLDDIDWEQERLHVIRSKSRRHETFPLDVTVGNSIASYLRYARPHSGSRVLFLSVQTPFRPMAYGALYHLVHYRLSRVISARKGRSPYGLRHACAQHLVDGGLSLKEIGDHLGHRCPDATRIYAKVDLKALRLVALEDLGDLP